LLIRELIKNSAKAQRGPAADSWAALERARLALAEVGEQVNESKRVQEQYEALLELDEVKSKPSSL
jgi:hypothetical protein